MDTPAVTLQSPRIAVFRIRAAARLHALATAMIPGSLVFPLLAPTRGLLAIGARLETWRLQSMCERGSLERGGRDIATWRDAVAAEVGGAGVFRDAAFGREALVELVESPVASPTQRLGAALALADAGDDVRTRVRVAADACANAALQQALGAVLERRLDEAMARQVERAEADEV